MGRMEMIADAFDRLFRTYERADRGTPEELARDRVDKAAVYFEAVEQYGTEDVLTAVRNFISGNAPGHVPSYIPPAPLVGAEARRVMNLRLDAESRARKPALPAPQVVNSPEAIERMTAKAQALIASLSASVRTEDAERDARQRDLTTRTDARFRPDMSPRAVRRRLGFSVGDPGGDADAA